MGYKGVCGIKIDLVLRLIQEKQEKNKGEKASVIHHEKTNGKSSCAEVDPDTVMIGFSEEEQTLWSKRCAANAGDGKKR